MVLDVDKCIAQLYNGELLAESQVQLLCSQVRPILANESNVVPLSAPVTVVGDVHGQYHDVLEIFAI
ncbi:putative serine/threonine protein phosphatase, partial [Kickxella alabastrina]